MKEHIIIGHRGAAGLSPENTLLSYNMAFELGAHMIELDVHETLDGHLVCIHDETVDRTTNGRGEVAKMTMAELNTLDAGQGERIPLLSDVLEFSRNRGQVNIEIKVLGIEDRLRDLLESKKMSESVIVSSFYHGIIIAIKELNPKLKTAALIGSPTPDTISYILEIGSDAVNPNFNGIERDFVENAKKHDLKVFPWTVNDYSTMMNLFHYGVDGIITDFPDIGLKALDYLKSNLQ